MDLIIVKGAKNTEREPCKCGRAHLHPHAIRLGISRRRFSLFLCGALKNEASFVFSLDTVFIGKFAEMWKNVRGRLRFRDE